MVYRYIKNCIDACISLLCVVIQCYINVSSHLYSNYTIYLNTISLSGRYMQECSLWWSGQINMLVDNYEINHNLKMALWEIRVSTPPSRHQCQLSITHVKEGKSNNTQEKPLMNIQGIKGTGFGGMCHASNNSHDKTVQYTWCIHYCAVG